MLIEGLDWRQAIVHEEVITPTIAEIKPRKLGFFVVFWSRLTYRDRHAVRP
jgi:hypothetical protein